MYIPLPVNKLLANISGFGLRGYSMRLSNTTHKRILTYAMEDLGRGSALKPSVKNVL